LHDLYKIALIETALDDIGVRTHVDPSLPVFPRFRSQERYEFRQLT